MGSERKSATESIRSGKLKKYSPSMRAPGDGDNTVPLDRFKVLGGERSAAKYADVMRPMGGKASETKYRK